MEKKVRVLLLCCFLFLLAACKDLSIEKERPLRSSSSSTNTMKLALNPMIRINGKLYLSTGFANSLLRCGTADGKIKSSVEASKIPLQEEESNFGKGYEYQFWSEDVIDVKIDGSWIVFQRENLTSSDIPSSVANFDAKVTNVQEDRLLIRVETVPEDFLWIFQTDSVKDIKPILVPIDSIFWKDKKEKVETKELVGMKIRVWVDGVIENFGSQKSEPLTFRQVYRVLPLVNEK